MLSFKSALKRFSLPYLLHTVGCTALVSHSWLLNICLIKLVALYLLHTAGCTIFASHSWLLHNNNKAGCIILASHSGLHYICFTQLVAP